MGVGPFYFAWIDYTTGGPPTFGPEHQVIDEEIVRFSIEQKENDFATLTMDVRNPRIGLLAPGRPVWAFLSYDSGTAGFIPLFFGRLVGVPTNLIQEVVTLQFIAKPIDAVAQKFALAETLKVRPNYDPVFIDPDKRPGTNTAGDYVGDPDVVLEGYSAFWHWDRITLELTISDLIVPEDGTEVFTADEIPYDSVEINIGEPPLTSVKVLGSVNWSQSATGTIDFGERWFDCWTGGSLKSSWPQTGGGLAGGWSVSEGWAIDVKNIEGLQVYNKHFTFENRSKTHTVGDVMSVQQSWTEFPCTGALWISNVYTQTGAVPAAAVISYDEDGVAFDPYAGIDSDSGDEKAIPMHVSYSQILVAGWLIHTKLVLQYDAGDKRNETAAFIMSADLQSIVTLPDPNDVVETLELSGSDVGLDIDGDIPIGDTSRNGYFPTDRGQWSVEYLLSVARAHLLHRARAVSVTWDCSFDRAIGLTLRKNAQISDNRLPGGTAIGKITSYAISADGDAAEMKGTITISCAIGHDGMVATAAGDPDYVEAGYVATGYQTYSGGTNSLGDIGYSVPVLEPGGLIYPLTKEQVIVTEEIRTSNLTSWTQVGSDTDRNGNTIKTFARYPITEYYLELVPITGNEFDAQYDIDVTTLKVPKLIDLEAATTL